MFGHYVWKCVCMDFLQAVVWVGVSLRASACVSIRLCVSDLINLHLINPIVIKYNIYRNLSRTNFNLTKVLQLIVKR